MCREKKDERELLKKQTEAAMETSRSLSRMGHPPARRQQAQGEAVVGQKRSGVSAASGKIELTDAEARLVKVYGQCRDFHRGSCKYPEGICTKGRHTGPPLIDLRAPGSPAWVPPAKK